jgi:hypothetical protein
MAQSIFPHRVAPTGTVQAEAWFRVHPNSVQERVEGYLAGFDAGTALKLVRAVRVDVEAVRRKCELATGDRIAAVAQWRSVRTDLRGTGRAMELTESEDEVEIVVDIPPGRSGGTLELRTSLILDAPAGNGRSPFAAAKPGDILWHDRLLVVLEGSGPRFPVEIRKFDLPPLSSAGWLLDWRPGSPDAMFMGSVRLLLNERHKAVIEAAKAVNRDLSQKMIVSAINADVARSLISGMLRNPEFLSAGTQYEKGTVGQVVGDLISFAFPGEDLNAVHMQLENEPETFAARLQSRLRLFGDG